MDKPKGPFHYTHIKLFFNSDRWAAWEYVGTLVAQGITHVGMAYDNGEWMVVWQDLIPPKLPFQN